jgi:hypothetical protein
MIKFKESVDYKYWTPIIVMSVFVLANIALHLI